jgi:hypothetical protein
MDISRPGPEEAQMDLSEAATIPSTWRRVGPGRPGRPLALSAAFLLAACTSLSTGPSVPSTDNHLLRTCPLFTASDHPTRIYEIKLTGHRFDPRDLHPVITEERVTAPPWTGGDSGEKQLTVIPPEWPSKTPLDLDLNSVIGEARELYGKREKVLIKIAIEDQEVTFRSDGYAISAGDHNGKALFCQFLGGFKNHEATFMTYYFKRGHESGDIYARYNVGLTLPDTHIGYVVPILLDPGTKNTG